MENGKQPINPIFNSDGFVSEFIALEDLKTAAIGLTKREYFAAMAMQGMFANSYATQKTIRTMKTPQEHAIELFTKMYDAPDDKGWVSQNKSRSINQAIIAIDEMIVQNGEIYRSAATRRRGF